MKQKDKKELLLKDLSARLPYHIRCKIWLKGGITEEGTLDLQHNYGDVLRDAFYYSVIKDIKPYLRPMSSMTEEDNLSLSKYVGCSIRVKYGEIYFPIIEDNTPDKWEKVFDWLNRKMFDYRGLIPMGLALEAQSGMYNN